MSVDGNREKSLQICRKHQKRNSHLFKTRTIIHFVVARSVIIPHKMNIVVRVHRYVVICRADIAEKR
jgi:hypothetical protein